MQSTKTSDIAPASTSADAALTVYYDGACPVCSREIALYQRQSGAELCIWVDASSCAESELGAGLSRDAALKRFHVRQADGVLVDGVRGFAALWRTLPRFSWAGRIASIAFFSRLLDIAYGVFLRARPLWQRAYAMDCTGAPVIHAGVFHRVAVCSINFPLRDQKSRNASRSATTEHFTSQ